MMLNPGFRTNISLEVPKSDLELAIQDVLVTTLQLVLTSGVGGMLIVNYAMRDLFVKEEGSLSNEPRFATDYEELMWLAQRQKHHINGEETRRFYKLRQEWTEMHAPLEISRTPGHAGAFAL